jgi:NodT family efflux transporter outer membrane factor (OMF) lipoprotein
MMLNLRRALVLSIVAAGSLGLSDCAVGPSYVAPKTDTSAAGPFVSAAPSSAASQPTPADWWRLYQDPVLDRLVREALVENNDLKVAAANLANANAVVSQARAGLFPSTDLTAAAGYGRSGTADLVAALTGTKAKAGWGYSTGFSAAYQIDLFGQIRRSIEAAKANAQAYEAVEDAVRVTVAGETAAAYANVCGYAQQAAVARHSLRLVQDSYDLTVVQRDAGSASDFDVARAATLMQQARAAIPTLDGQRRAALFELTALLGKTPAQAPADAAACQTPPRLNQPLPVGDGAALLRRRPDVRQAERRLASATANIGVAIASLYPSVSLGGAINAGAAKPSQMFNYGSVSYSAGPLISWTFPNTLVALAQIRQARAAASGALAGFDSTVLRALKEAEQALTAYAAELDRHAALANARDRADEAYRLAKIQFDAGAASYLDLLSAETTLVAAEQALAASDQQISSDQVAVFQALGGGWEDAPVVTPPAITSR